MAYFKLQALEGQSSSSTIVLPENLISLCKMSQTGQSHQARDFSAPKLIKVREYSYDRTKDLGPLLFLPWTSCDHGIDVTRPQVVHHGLFSKTPVKVAGFVGDAEKELVAFLHDEHQKAGGDDTSNDGRTFAQRRDAACDAVKALQEALIHPNPDGFLFDGYRSRELGGSGVVFDLFAYRHDQRFGQGLYLKPSDTRIEGLWEPLSMGMQEAGEGDLETVDQDTMNRHTEVRTCTTDQGSRQLNAEIVTLFCDMAGGSVERGKLASTRFSSHLGFLSEVMKSEERKLEEAERLFLDFD